MTKTKVLWLVKGLGLGGAERLLTLVAAKLDRTRFEVEVAYLLPWKDAFVPRLAEEGIPTICLGMERSMDLGWVVRLRREVRTKAYAIVHTHSPVPAVAARLTTPAGVKLVHTEHNVWQRYRWPTYVGNALTYARNDAVFAVSEGVATSISSPWWTPGQSPAVETLLHGVNPDTTPRGSDARAGARGLLGIDAARPVVGCVANLTRKKDHRCLLQAIDRLRARDLPEVLLLIVGTGPLEHDLRSEVTTLGLEQNVRFLGARPDVPALLPALDVFVLSSRYEGLPIALLEAMAAEVACVSTRVGGIPEVITDGIDGRLVPVAQPEALAAAVSELFSDRSRRREIASAGRARVRAAFTIDRAARRTEELYDELLS